MKAFPSASMEQSFQRLSIKRNYSHLDRPAQDSKLINLNQERLDQLYEPDPSLFKKITEKDPVYAYQNRSFEDIFGGSCESPRVMSPTQFNIRKSIISVSERKNPSFSNDSPLSLEHVSSSESISSRLDNLESSSNDLKYVASAFRSLLDKHAPSDDEFDPLKYKYEIILKGIEEGNILNVIYLILGFDEEKQDAINSKFTGQGSRLFSKDYSGKLRIETVNQKLLTINLPKLMLISEEMPFLFYKFDHFTIDRGAEFRSLSYQQSGTKRPISIDLNSQTLSGNYKKYTSVSGFFDELISDLDQRNIHVFESKVRQFNAFQLNQDDLILSSPKRRFYDEQRVFVAPMTAQ